MPRGYEIIAARDGETALAKAAAEPPDLILLDIMMPAMSGFEVLQKLRSDEKTRFIPVVMITALRETEDRVKAIESGCDDFISKPFDKDELLARVKSLLRIKFLHDEVSNSYEKLKELEKLKDALTHMIIHDLNNPLTGVLGNLQLLQMDLGDALSAEQKTDIENALLSCGDMKKMIDNLLDINKIEEGQIKLHSENFNLDEAVREVVERMLVTSRLENKTILLESGGKAFGISADKELIKRVIANLINNALKHTPAGGVIQIEVSLNEDEHIFYTRVKDSGEGIPKDYLGKIFDKFVQVEDRKARMGRGLGLTFCKLAVEAHGGKIWAESELGRGSVFTFTLPCKQPSL